ncbi:hypothetical protein C6501_05025 [Candidatus Poribacteria bacterium]|nr:MAG: hypothetical protein C6501_05025 [Candidatus Poribacteria bacterium]
MTFKHLFLILFVLLFGFGAFILLRDTNVLSDGDKLKPKFEGASVSTLNKASRVALHPLASDWKAIETAVNQLVSTWEEWVQRTVEISLAEDVLYGLINTPEELAAARKKDLAVYMEWAARSEAKGSILPNYPFGVPRVPDDELDSIYKGPQTASALIAEFDQNWMERYPQSVDWDTHYPKAAWLRKVISLGVKIQDGGDYGYYLKLRRDLIKHKDTPDRWRSGEFGISPTSNFEEYESAYINRKIWENQKRKEVRAAYPDEPQITTFFPSSQPDKYLPVVGNMTYVYRRPNSSGMRTYGTLLTQEQKINLRDKGIEPEDIEIIYIDDEYNVLTEKPKPYNHEEWLKNNTYDHVPEGLRAPDGTIVSPERYREIIGEEMPYETRQKYDEHVGAESPIDPNTARREAAQEAAAREVAKVEFERFRDSMRQREEFKTMADQEVARELAKQFSQQFLSKQSLKQGTTPKGLEDALQIMFQHGFEEGFRRVRRDSPSIADELERYLSETQGPPKRQGPPQRPGPQKPPEAAPPEPEAP